MSNLRKFIEAVRSGDGVPRELASEAADHIERCLDAKARGGRNGKPTPRLTDPRAVATRERVRRHRMRKASSIE
jgi:hypothetical protein